MIYFTTLIFTLLLSHIARAIPACGDVAPPEDQYVTDTGTYDDEQLVLATYKVTWNAKYDNPDGSTSGVACSNGPHGLAGHYPHFKDFPDYPYLGGAYDTTHGSSNCGKCWKLTNKKTPSRWIYFTAIDGTGSGYDIGKKAYTALNGGTAGSGSSLDAEAQSVAGHFCGFK
jgi:Cerato-platanin